MRLFVPGTGSEATVEAVSAGSKALVEPQFGFFGVPGPSRLTRWPVGPDGIGGVRLGEHRDDVRARMGEGMRFRPYVAATLDQYWAEGLVVWFDADQRVVEIVAVEPAVPTIGGIEVLGRTRAQLRQAMAGAGLAVVERSAELLVSGINARVWWMNDEDRAAVAVQSPSEPQRRQSS